MPTPRQILSVNRLIPRKRVDWVLRAVGALTPEERLRIEVKIAGSGPERVRLETMARELDIAKRVFFLGEVSSKELEGLYLRADLFILASRAEGFSNALLEAMAYGLPCLAATPTGFHDVDEALVAFDSPQDLARCIRLLFGDSGVYGERSRACLEASSRYSWEKAAERYRDLLLDVSG